MRRRIFVGRSREAVDVCRAVQAELNDEFDVTVWDQDVFSLSYSALDSLLEALDSSDAGIFVLRPDDLTTRRGIEEATVRDNVIFELGMFIGRLNRARTLMLTPAESSLHMPTDHLGITTASYDSRRLVGRESRAAMGPACTQIRTQLDAQQARVDAEPETRARLDRAMRRLSRDLESLLGPAVLHAGTVNGQFNQAEGRIGRANVHIEAGRIEDHGPGDGRTAVAFPANEYFDDECVTDINSSPRARRAVTLRLHLTPTARGRRLVRHHTYGVTLRLWVSYTPTGGRTRTIGIHGLHIPK